VCVVRVVHNCGDDVRGVRACVYEGGPVRACVRVMSLSGVCKCVCVCFVCVCGVCP